MLALVFIFGCALTILDRWDWLSWRSVVTHLRIGYGRLCRPRRIVRDASTQCNGVEDLVDQDEDEEGLPP